MYLNAFRFIQFYNQIIDLKKYEKLAKCGNHQFSSCLREFKIINADIKYKKFVCAVV